MIFDHICTYIQIIYCNFKNYSSLKSVTMKQKSLLLVLILIFFAGNIAAQQVIAHRGYWKTEGSAQNSIAALMKADAIKVYGSEVDILISSDGIPVVNHDAYVTLDGKKLIVEDTPFSTLRQVKLSNGESLPTVEEYLDALKKCDNIKLIIEFKKLKSKESEDMLVQKVVNLVNERDLQDKVEYISFGINYVQQVRRLAPNSSVYYLNGDLTPQILSKMGAGLDYHHNVFDKRPEWVKEAHENGQKVNVWTVNKKEDIIKVIHLNVDFITTDEPLMVKELIKGNDSE